MTKNKKAHSPAKAAIQTVEMPSRKLAAKIAKDPHSSVTDRVEFSRSLVRDAKNRASHSLRKLAAAS